MSGMASFGRSLKAVAWSFFGVRKSADYERDVETLNPVHVVVAGVVGALVFIGTLMLVVKWLVATS